MIQKKTFSFLKAEEDFQKPQNFTHSSVAGILAGDFLDGEILLIKRLARTSDPWSGHLAFPGGLRDPQDSSLLATAIRETAEEVGIELSQGDYLGSMDYHSPKSDIKIRGQRLLVQPNFFHFARRPELTIDSSEVDSAFWVPLKSFLQADLFHLQNFQLSSSFQLKLPSMKLPQGELWGVTYVLALKFLGNYFSHLCENQILEKEEFESIRRFWNLTPYI